MMAIDAAPAGRGAGPPDAAAPIGPAFTVTGVATWRGDAVGAYSLVQDGVCDLDGAFTHGDPELTRRGLHGGFAVIVGSCGMGTASKWPRVKALREHGHDLLNHSWSHPCLGTVADCQGQGARSTDLALEIDRSSEVLASSAGGPIEFFVFPFDTCGPDALGRLKQRGYLGARCGARGVSDARLADGFAVRFDSWGPSFSAYGNAGPCRGLVMRDANVAPDSLPVACRSYVLDQYVDDAIAGHGWALRALTGFTDERGVFQPISLADYTAHLDQVRRKVDAGQLWVEGPSVVLRYRFARQTCPMPTVVDGRTLRFPEPSAECRRHATAVSYLVSTTSADLPSLQASQAGSVTMARKTAPGRFVVDADPTRGDVTLAVF
jgi:hypothetical protein